MEEKYDKLINNLKSQNMALMEKNFSQAQEIKSLRKENNEKETELKLKFQRLVEEKEGQGLNCTGKALRTVQGCNGRSNCKFVWVGRMWVRIPLPVKFFTCQMSLSYVYLFCITGVELHRRGCQGQEVDRHHS